MKRQVRIAVPAFPVVPMRKNYARRYASLSLTTSPPCIVTIGLAALAMLALQKELLEAGGAGSAFAGS